ncbi:MAG: hypothetical protein U0451_02325 [Candidatus Saccharimonadales bacterium]
MSTIFDEIENREVLPITADSYDMANYEASTQAELDTLWDELVRSDPELAIQILKNACKAVESGTPLSKAYVNSTLLTISALVKRSDELKLGQMLDC